MATRNEFPHAACDGARLERLLDGLLSPGELAEAEAHLEVCRECSERLEAAAAEEAFRADAQSFLRDDGLDEETAEFGLAPGTTAGKPPADRPEVHRIQDYLDATDDPRMLGRFGGYEIAGVVGGGGMGVVLKGYEPALDRFVAIKVLAPHLAASGAARARFAREAKAAAAVIHENVAAIHRVAEANGLPYLVMPYLAGESLQRRLDERGPLDLLEALRIAAQVASGLAAAHAQGLVHRDVKPGNVLLDRGVERVVLTDFGLARAADDASLTHSGVIAGTPQYMSPEQARGEPVDHRSDLFSLGSLLYAMLAGRPPFRAESSFGVLRKISDAEPRPLRDAAPHAPDWLCEIVERLMAKVRGDRFQTADEVANLLGAWIAHVQRPGTMPAPRRLRRPGRRASGRKAALLTAAALVLGLLGVGGVAAVIHLAKRVPQFTARALPQFPLPAAVADAPADAGSSAIYVIGSDGEGLRRLVRFGEYTGQGSADWSADGTKIAFDAWRPSRGEGGAASHVIVVDADGNDPRDLGPGALPSWSPDGRMLTFSTYSPRAVWLMKADGSDRRTLDSPAWCSRWSPDGKTIAYTVDRNGRGDICLHDVGTDRRRYLFDRSGSPYRMIYWSFCWSPDSQKLCFLAVRVGGEVEMATVSVNGPEEHFRVHRRGPASAAFAWHPDGVRILMAVPSPEHGAKRLFTFPADGSGPPVPVPGIPDEFGATPGDWSPEGESLAFTGFPERVRPGGSLNGFAGGWSATRPAVGPSRGR